MIAEPESVMARESPVSWGAYNAGQEYEKEMVLMMLCELLSTIEEPEQQGRGRPKIPLRDALFFAVMRVYGTKSARRSVADFEEFYRNGYTQTQPSRSLASSVLAREGITGMLQAFIQQTARCVVAIETDFAVDSTGFKTCGGKVWHDKKYAKHKARKAWLKAHAMVGVTTHIVTSVEIAPGNTADYTRLVRLTDSTKKHFRIVRVSADLAYSGRSNLAAIEAVGARPLIPFRSGTGHGKGAARGTPGQEVWHRLFMDFKQSRDEFMRHYGLRSNVETTFHMVKARFGSRVRARRMPAQENEILCKILLHNLCCLVKAYFQHGVTIQLRGDYTVTHV